MKEPEQVAGRFRWYDMEDLERLIMDADTAARSRGDVYGLCDATDNAGQPYPSAWSALIIEAIYERHARPTSPNSAGENP